MHIIINGDRMLKKVEFKRLFVSILSVASIVLVGMIFTKGSYSYYDELIKPELAPKAIVFPIAWSIIYIILAITLYLICGNKKTSIFLFLNLINNVIWPILFFKLKLLLLSVYWLILLIISLIYLLYLLFKQKKLYAYLNVPYLLWCFFALYLNIMIYLINK